MTRRAGLALATILGECYVAVIWWAAKHADATVCRWTQDTAGGDER